MDRKFPLVPTTVPVILNRVSEPSDVSSEDFVTGWPASPAGLACRTLRQQTSVASAPEFLVLCDGNRTKPIQTSSRLWFPFIYHRGEAASYILETQMVLRVIHKVCTVLFPHARLSLNRHSLRVHRAEVLRPSKPTEVNRALFSLKVLTEYERGCPHLRVQSLKKYPH